MKRCLGSIFADRVRKMPNAIAIRYEERQLTYQELDRRSNAIAAQLLTHGVKPDSLVGLLLERSPELVVGMLAITKAGGAYVPIDPAYPASRIQFILDDCDMPVVVSSTKHARLVESTSRTVVNVDANAAGETATSPDIADLEEANLAYVIYTSGTTGTPNGVQIEHRNVVSLFEHAATLFELRPDDVWTMFHSPSFDFSVWEIWGALLYGRSLVIVPEATVRNPAAFRELLIREKVTVLSQTPSAFRQLVVADDESAEHGRRSAYSLRYIVFGGEALSYDTPRKWMERYGENPPALINMYGITETTVHVTFKRLSLSEQEPSGSAIGTALPGMEIALFDDAGREIEGAGQGEIYVSGSGVARAYLNRPERTSERFVWKKNAGIEKRYYRSGDHAARDAHGNLVYQGRMDLQLKVRGYRIEAGEVEACLESHPGVAQASVIAHDFAKDDVRLIAFVVTQPRWAMVELGFAELRKQLLALVKKTLPAYIQPSSYVAVRKIPLTPHGKLDRSALVRMLDADVSPLAAPQASESRGVEDLSLIVGEILRCTVSPNDDLFDLGATSLAIIRILSRVNREFQVNILPTDLLDEATINKLSECVRQKTRPAQLVPPIGLS